MENVFIYLIKASGLIGLFYLAYILLLRKETFFNGNRWFLLLGLITSCILPLFFITKVIWVEPTTDSFDWSNIPVTTLVNAPEPEINWYLIVAGVYIIGIAISFLKLAFDFNSLIKLLNGKTIQQQGNFKLIDIAENIAPFSFFNYIVFNSSLYSVVELENILEHEKVHSQQKHSVDVLLSSLFCILFWFNPLIWLYKKAIAQNLEFIADNEAAKRIADKKAYQLTLLKITTQDNCVALTNHFYQSLIKKRIIMLNQNPSEKSNSWKYITVFPALVTFVFLFQIKVVAQEKETKSESVDLKSFKVEKDLNNISEGKEIYINGKKSTEEELAKLDSNDIEKIDVATISGKKTILVTTKHNNNKTTIKVTDKDIYINGAKSTKEELDKLNPKEIESMDVIKDKKEIRIFTKDWLKKSKEFTFYIDDKKVTPQEYYSFNPEMIECSHGNLDEKTIRITTKTKKEENKNSTGSGLSFRNSNTKQDFEKPLIVIDGIKKDFNFKIEDVDPDNIKSITVLKDHHATMKYNESGKNGVIEITMKDKRGNIAKESQLIKVLGYAEQQDKEVNGWKVSGFSSLDGTKPLIVIDEKTKDPNFNMEDIPKDQIKKIEVLKGKIALDKYGEKGKNGVIEIKTK